MRLPIHDFCRFTALLLVFLAGCATNKSAEAPFDPETLGITERVRYYQDALQKDPENAEHYYRYGNALLDMGRFQDAYAAYQSAIQRKPDYADAYANLGLALRRMGNLKAAAGAYLRALEITPDDGTTLDNLMAVARLMEDWERVDWCFERMAALSPDQPALLASRAELLQQIGRPGEAAVLFVAAAGAGVEPARNLYRAGVCHADQGRWDKVIEAWEAARKLEPENAAVNKGLAVAYWEAGDVAGSRAAVARCKEIGVALPPEFLLQLEGSGR